MVCLEVFKDIIALNRRLLVSKLALVWAEQSRQNKSTIVVEPSNVEATSKWIKPDFHLPRIENFELPLSTVVAHEDEELAAIRSAVNNQHAFGKVFVEEFVAGRVRCLKGAIVDLLDAPAGETISNDCRTAGDVKKGS